jgi:squalene-hopene/tetraprenyl-beta-curcumene cyclase
MIDPNQLTAAYEKARRDLLAERLDGHWVGQLSSSALSTATAISALSIAEKYSKDESGSPQAADLIRRGLDWLLQHQNPDGGWGDTDKSLSNIATTMLVQAAFHLAGRANRHADVLNRAKQYIDACGGLAALRQRYGKDKTFVVPILTNCALAGLAPWSAVSPLPFELACLPHPLLRFLRLPVVSYALPALVAIGQAGYFHRKPLNPITRSVRRLCVKGSLKKLQEMQPDSGGYLEAVPLTSFVVMSLAATGRADHCVVRQGVRFILSSHRPDGSWPIDTNLAAWTTTLAINALAARKRPVGPSPSEDNIDAYENSRCLQWLLSCQHGRTHPFTHALPGGWGWTDLSGAVPDADDTSGALLALAVLERTATAVDRQRIATAADSGVEWLLDIQNSDGGWPTFCRGWGTMPFDRSGADLSAHAVRALHAWRGKIDRPRIAASIERGLRYLAEKQREDGSWLPLWFGNQYQSGEENPWYGTSRVLLAYRDLGLLDEEHARQGVAFLAASTNSDGGWGAAGLAANDPRAAISSVEETALVLEALLGWRREASLQPIIDKGLRFLVAAVADGRLKEPSPIGLYFAKLWYYERLYPLCFTVAALGSALDWMEKKECR